LAPRGAEQPPAAAPDNLTKAHHFVRRGLGKRESGEERAAIQLFSRALRVDPRCHVALLLRGAAHFRLWDMDAALADFSGCLAADGRNTMALYNRALTYFALGNWHSCIADLTACLDVNPRDADALQLRGLVHRRMHAYDAAHQDYSTLMYANMAAARATAAPPSSSARGGSGSASTLPPGSPLRAALLTSPAPGAIAAAAAAAAAGKRPGMPAAVGGAPPPLGGGLGRSASEAHLPGGSATAGASPPLARAASLATLAPIRGAMGRAALEAAAAGIKPLGGAASTHSIAGLSMTPEQTEAQLRELLTGGTDLYSIVFEKSTDIQLALHKVPRERTAEDLAVVETMLRSLVFFRALTPDMQRGMARGCFAKSFAEGDVITQEGDPVRYLYVLLSGECTVKVSVEGSRGDGVSPGSSPAAAAAGGDDGGVGGGGGGGTEISVDTYKTGDHFGHLSLLFGEARTLTVIVKSPTVELLMLPRTAFFRLGLDDAFITDLERRRDVLARTGAFDSWTEPDLLKLCCAAKYRQCRKHTTLIKQGDIPREFIVLTKGIVHVFKASDALADVDLRMKTLHEELASIRQLFTYHHSMRKRAGAVAVVAPEPLSDTEEGSKGAPRPSSRSGGGEGGGDRVAAMGRLVGRGSTAASTLAAALRAVRAAGGGGGGAGDGEAGEAGGEEGMRLASGTKYRAPAVAALPMTFVEEYGRELEAKLVALGKQRQAVLKAMGREGGGGGVSGGGGGGGGGGGVSSATQQFRVHVESLYPPCILSPLAITDPWHGFEPGDCVAETYVELLVVSKTQIDHRMFSKAQLADIQSRAPRFPRDGVVVDRFRADAEWHRFQKDVVDRIDKRRWPAAQHNARIEIKPGGRYLIVPLTSQGPADGGHAAGCDTAPTHTP